MIYQYMYSTNGTLNGYTDHSLSYFNVSNFPPGTAPTTTLITGVSTCRSELQFESSRVLILSYVEQSLREIELLVKCGCVFCSHTQILDLFSGTKTTETHPGNLMPIHCPKSTGLSWLQNWHLSYFFRYLINLFSYKYLSHECVTRNQI